MALERMALERMSLKRMALDPEEFVTLTDHGSMKLRAAVLRAMTLPSKERKRTTIVRKGKPAILNFEQIKNLAAQWDQRLAPIAD